MTALELHPQRGSVRFTLRGIFRTDQAAQTKIAELQAKGLECYSFDDESPAGNRLHFVAARHAVVPASRAGIPQNHSADWEATRMAVEMFRRVSRAARRGGSTVRWYKNLDVDALRACFQGIPWNTRLDVASSMLSRLIVVHPFPNANHRTSLFLTRSYLESEGIRWPHYNLQGRGAARFHRDTHSFFKDSKYYLQLIRHRDLVRIAHEEGFTALHLGPASDVAIDPADLRLTPQDLRKKHLARATKLVRDLAGPHGEGELDQPTTRRLRQWVAWYQG